MKVGNISGKLPSYDSSLRYKINDGCFYNGKLYVCLVDDTSELPTVITDWKEFNPEGVQGPIGPQGAFGNDGPQGALGVDGVQGPQGLDGQDGVQGPIAPECIGGAPLGAVEFFAMQTPPTGWLECNGALINRITYADLFNKIGSTFGDGDGSTTFALPDLRGEFIRGWDHGRGVDAGRSFATTQADELKSHNHNLNCVNFSYSGGYGWVSGTYGAGQPTQNTGGTETRPRNIALLPCIKYSKLGDADSTIINVGINPNLLINSNFAINQRDYISGSALAIGAFGHDRWKALVASSYVFTQSTAITAITITGTIAQIIEAGAIQGGNYVLSWSGTAIATVNGTAVANGGNITISAGMQTTVAFSSGTLSNPKFEFGSTATTWQVPDQQQELARCQRYYQKMVTTTANELKFLVEGTASSVGVYFRNTMLLPVKMRVYPTVAWVGTWQYTGTVEANRQVVATADSLLYGAMSSAAGTMQIYTYATIGTGFTLDAEI